MPKNVFAGVGISNNDNPFNAGKEAAQKAIKKMKDNGGKTPIFGLMICCARKYGKDDKTIQKVVNGTHSILKNVPWIGCTASGEITPKGIQENHVVVAVIDSEYMKFGVGVGVDVSDKPREAGKKAVKMGLNNLKMDKYLDSYLQYMVTKTKKPSELIKQRQFAILILTKGYTMKKSGWGEDVLDGMKEVVGTYTPIVGGSATGTELFEKNYQFANGKFYTDAVICAAIFSNVKIGFGLAHGYKPTKNIALVTKSKGNVVYELNGKPAVDEYVRLLNVPKEDFLKNYGFMGFGKKVPESVFKLGRIFGMTTDKMMEKIQFFKYVIEKPFGVPDIHGGYWLKMPIGIYKETGLEFNTRVPEKLPLILMEIDKDSVVSAYYDSLKQATSVSSKKPVLLISFECAGRYITLSKMNRLKESYKKIESKFKPESIVGFYTAGEYGLTTDMPAGEHVYTCTSFVITDELITEK